MTSRERKDDEAVWVPPFSIPLRRIRPHFWTFSLCFVATLVFYIFVTSSWPKTRTGAKRHRR